MKEFRKLIIHIRVFLLSPFRSLIVYFFMLENEAQKTAGMICH